MIMWFGMFFSFYFIYFRLFSLGFAHLGIAMPRTAVIILLSLITVLLIKFIPFSFSKKVYNYIKTLYEAVNKSVLILSAALSGLCGQYIILFGIDRVEIGGLSAILAAVSGICISFVFFTALLQCVFNVRHKILAFLAVFADLKFVAVIIAFNFLTILYVFLSKQVYFWDNAGYWQSSASLAEIVFANSKLFFQNLTSSIFNSDYNSIPAVIPSMIMALFGSSRLVFTLAILNFYFVPFLAFVYMTTKKITEFLIIVLAFPMAFYLTVIGFLDVGGIFLSVIILYTFLFNKRNLGFDFLNGVVLCLLILFRRWYIFFAIVFLICMIAYSAVLRGVKIKKAAVTFMGFLTSFFIFFQGYFTKRLLGNNYADLYSAYKFTFDTDIKIFLRYFGIVLVLSITVYIIYNIISYRKSILPDKKEKLINMIFLFMCACIMFILFTYIQTHGQQHLLLYVPPLALILFYAVQDVKREKIIFSAVSVLCIVSIFLPRIQPQTISQINAYSILPSFSAYPVVREDADSLAELDEYVRGLDGKTAVLASSFILNADILSKAEASLNPAKPLIKAAHILSLPAVDKRDGKPYGIANADYIVAASPIQTHLAPEDQQVVVIPAMMLMSETSFSSAFEKLDITFKLRDGVEVYIYKRLRANTEEEMNEVWENIKIGG